MNALPFYQLARKRGLSPQDAMDDAHDQADQPDDVQTSAGQDDTGDDSSWGMPDFTTQAPPGPTAPPMTQAPQAPQGISAQLSAALARARARTPMPDNINDDALTKQLQDDEDSTKRGEVSEAIRAAFARQAPRATSAKPSAALQALMQKRSSFDKQQGQDQQSAMGEARLLEQSQPKPIDPSLAALHEASAAQLRELASQRDSREARDAAETKRKADVATTAKTAEDASVESQRAIMGADPRVKKLGITPEVLAKLDRKGLEDVARQLGPKGAAAATGTGQGHRLSPEALKELAGIDSADKQLQDLEAEGSRVGLDSFKNQVVSVLPERLKANTDIGNYEDSARRAMQGVGLILEHGKLAAGDEVKYRKLLPEPGDNAVTLHHKIAGLRKYLADLKSGQQAQYSAGGYRVPGGGGGGPVKMKFPDGSTHDVDAADVELARRKGGTEVSGG